MNKEEKLIEILSNCIINDTSCIDLKLDDIKKEEEQEVVVTKVSKKFHGLVKKYKEETRKLTCVRSIKEIYDDLLKNLMKIKEALSIYLTMFAEDQTALNSTIVNLNNLKNEIYNDEFSNKVAEIMKYNLFNAEFSNKISECIDSINVLLFKNRNNILSIEEYFDLLKEYCDRESNFINKKIVISDLKKLEELIKQGIILFENLKEKSREISRDNNNILQNCINSNNGKYSDIDIKDITK